jgi:hypothetical protein
MLVNDSVGRAYMMGVSESEHKHERVLTRIGEKVLPVRQSAKSLALLIVTMVLAFSLGSHLNNLKNA